MKIFRLIGMLLIGSSTLFSCSNNEDELPPKEQEQTNQETYTISFNLGGEFISTSETPLSRTEVTPKKIYGINVYYKKDGDTQYQNYAYTIRRTETKNHIILLMLMDYLITLKI